MKHKLNTYLKTGILLFGISFFVIACQKDDTISKEEQNTNVKTPIITTLSYEQTNETFNRLKDELKINPYLKQTRFSGLQARPTQDTLGLTIATDIIKQVTLGNYTSYTMEIIQETDSTVFFNLTIEDKNGESSMFVTKYTPTAYWLNNKNEVYQGGIQFREPATLTEWTDPNDIFEQDLGGGFDNPELGTGLGGTGGTYNADYPTNCFGTVIVTTQLVAYQCDCGDWPWDDCQGCTTSPQWPGFEQVTLYVCEENWDIEDPYNPGDTGNSGGVSLPDPTDEPSISAMIKPEECIERLVGDIDGDCALSPYEWCLLGNNSQEICDCVAEGNTLAECIDIDLETKRNEIIECLGIENNWLNTTVASEQIAAINNYLIIENNCSEEAQEFAVLAIENNADIDDMIFVVENQQDYRDIMSEDELNLFDILSNEEQMLYLVSAKQAIDKTEEIFSTFCERYNGKGDAFRHAYWNALSSQRIGIGLTDQLTTRHENRPPLYPYSSKETEMDLFNNAIGRDLVYDGMTNPLLTQQAIEDLLNNGSLRYLSNQASNCLATFSSQLIPTNQ